MQSLIIRHHLQLLLCILTKHWVIIFRLLAIIQKRQSIIEFTKVSCGYHRTRSPIYKYSLLSNEPCSFTVGWVGSRQVDRKSEKRVLMNNSIYGPQVSGGLLLHLAVSLETPSTCMLQYCRMPGKPLLKCKKKKKSPSKNLYQNQFYTSFCLTCTMTYTYMS